MFLRCAQSVLQYLRKNVIRLKPDESRDEALLVK